MLYEYGKHTRDFFEVFLLFLRWLKTVSNTYIWIGHYNHCLSFDATIIVSKNCPIIGEYVVIIFLDTIGYHSNSMTSEKHP